MSTVNEKMTAIADAIRDKTGGTDALTLDNMATDIPKVYDNGKKSEYDRFWDSYQDNGNRTNYNGAFYGKGWNNETFRPKYDIKPTGANIASMLRETSITGDLKTILEDLGVVFDTSGATSFSYTFYSNAFERLPFIDASDAITAYVFANSSRLKELEIKVTEKTSYNNTFNNCPALENFVIEGTIGQNGFNVSSSTLLTHDSLMGIINCLKDVSGEGTTKTCTLGATNLAKLTDSEKALATQKGWTLA